MTFRSISEWLDKAAQVRSTSEYDVRIDRLTNSERDELAVHLADIAEASGRILESIGSLALVDPDSKALDAALFDVESGVAHTVAHWRYLASLLTEWGMRAEGRAEAV